MVLGKAVDEGPGTPLRRGRAIEEPALENIGPTGAANAKKRSSSTFPRRKKF